MIRVRFIDGGKLMTFYAHQLRLSKSGKVTAPTGIASRANCEIVEYLKG